MKHGQYIYCLFFMLFSFASYGQIETGKDFINSKRQSPASILEKAKSAKEESPSEAISILEEAIDLAKKEKDRKTEGEAYFLLGNIYEDIGQNELALGRYAQAIKTLRRKKNGGLTAGIHQRMGQLYLKLKDDGKAETSFLQCLKLTNDKELKILCEEGLADVELLRGNVEKSFEKLDYVKNNYALDSLSNARVEARRSQGYIQQNDFPNASEAFRNSVENMPRNKVIKKEDIVPIENAKQMLLDYSEISNLEKINIRQNSASNLEGQFFVNNTIVTDNLRTALLYDSDGNFAEAKKFLSISKNSINENTEAEVAAGVYKKSYELNLKRGNTAAASSDLKKYLELKERAIQDLKKNLNEQIEIVKSQKDIDQLLNRYDLEEKDEALLESQLKTQKIFTGLLGLLLVASLVFFYFLYKNIKAKRLANQKLLLRSLRTQMNPHFIFNALNSVNNFIAKNDEKSANKFLTNFSRLMRKVLDYSQMEFISFEEELELNELYLKLEHFRFRDKFDYELTNNIKSMDSDIMVPPMLIQPFIENAVWHGLRYKEGMGKLSVTINENEDHLAVTILDDGIGRKRSKELKTKNQKAYKSTGLENVHKRISLINEIYDKKYDIVISDVDEGAEETGTLVEIKIPIQ